VKRRRVSYDTAIAEVIFLPHCTNIIHKQ